MKLELNFIWDPDKAKQNRLKHGIEFDEAVDVFEDEFSLLMHDHKHSEREDRWLLIGLSSKLKILVVVHTEYLDNKIRILSARVATTKEANEYKRRR